MKKTHRSRRFSFPAKRRKKAWQIQEAKAKFSELIDVVQKEGMQTITKNGEEVAVLLSKDKFEEMREHKNDLVDFFKKAPFSDIDLQIERSKDLPREFEL
jgi:prevent-host-death family protein